MVAYTDRLRLEKQATNTNQNTWGSVLNSNVFDLVDEAVGGVEVIALTGANVTLTTANGATDQARNMSLRFTGTGSVTVTIPSVEKTYIVQNASNGDVTFSAGGTTATVGSGDGEVIYTDGTDCYACLRISSKIAAAITPVANAGTVKITASDTTGRYLNDAIAVTGLSKTVVNSGADEYLQLTAQNGLALISTATASSSASVEFTGIDGTYDRYIVHVINAVPATDGQNFQMRTSTNGGSSYDSGASDYAYVTLSTKVSSASASVDQTAGTTQLRIFGNLGVGGAANETGVCAEVVMNNPSAAQYCQISASGSFVNSSGQQQNFIGAGQRLAAADVDAIQFTFSSGNIASGEFKLYGVKAS